MSSSTEYAYARLEAIVYEQNDVQARMDALCREDAVRRGELTATLASLAREYDQLYLALDAYADLESNLDPLGLGALIATMPGT